ncbi:MAG TPA: TIR domain-containing protein [Methylomusa anaerophila]|uniref:TIR domain-containing protein n=1 Tax=Methylomusa anaerophila TaxID=1930071 RepID=A0A348AGS5_9FIRM|nr:TIR domain-containing protein [Methylomusa anaerophila]BBB90273.1 hypothetical protein MAMMFC1_00921 [Methylomusa anaerophila]HML89382.1 TIR domain-containing protein [Methylomusa anaerophila]
MKVYVVDPKITLGHNVVALAFYNTCRIELEKHVETTSIMTEIVMESAKPTDQDVMVFFNRADQAYPEYFISFLQDVLRTGCGVFPVAIAENHRYPPEIASSHQSYDVAEQLQQRKLTTSQIETVAVALARTVVSRLQPSLTKHNMKLFLSHRRFDGEKIAGAFHDELQVRMQHVFRDLNAVLVGEEAQEIIERNLCKSDAVVFLDTPRCGESEWVALELRIALARHLPIVWIKIGPNNGRAGLTVVPAGEPHFNRPDIDTKTRNVGSGFVDDVIHKAFEISREYAKNVFGHLRRVRTLADEGSIELKELSFQHLTYQVQIPRRNFRYFQRPMTHVVGFYGRIPQDDDRLSFLNNLEQLGYKPHPVLGHFYDAALMLAPVALQSNQVLVRQPHLVDSCAEYVNSLEKYLRSLSQQTSPQKRGIIISGAFPDCEPEHQQHLTDAIYAFTQAILDREGIVIFGAHPTFQHLIFDMARQRRPDDFVQSVHMYASKYFVTDAAIDEFKKHATTIATEVVGKDRAKSLTTMRRAMIQDKEAAAMVVMGGKTNRADIPPGVDEEIELAKAAGLPVFIIGSVGGRAAELASLLDADNWKEKPNHLSPAFNHELMVSLDYSLMAKEILDKLGL